VRSGNASRRRLEAGALLLAILLVSGPDRSRAGEADPRFETVMAHFAASRGVVAHFREEKTLPLLAQPLVSDGVLYYAPPGRMVRFTSAPEPTSLLLDGDRLRMQDSLGVEEIDLGSHTAAQQFVDQLLVLFRGDARAMRERYEIEFEWRDGPWSLRLTPKSLRVRAVILEIALAGRDRALVEMVVRGAAGEVTRTTYRQVDVDRAFRPEELAALFPSEGAPRALPDAPHP
jgi:outer membrane lipoprotein-sorting protein